MRLRRSCLLALAIAVALPACSRAGDATDADADPTPPATADTASTTTAGDPAADASAGDGAAAPTTAADAAAAVPSGQWQYTGDAGDTASAHSAAIAGSDGLQLRFEDDPTWGRSAYLQGAQDVFDDEAMGVVSPEMVGAYRSFAVAVRNEERAFAFWSYIAANGVSPEIRDAAERMAREELEHAKTLRRERRKAFFEDRRLGTAIREPYDLSSLEMEVCTRLEEHADMNGNKKEYRDLALEARMLSLDLASDPLQDPAPVGPPPPRSLDALCEWLADYYIDAGEHLLSQAARDRCQALATIAVKRLAVVRDLEKK